MTLMGAGVDNALQFVQSGAAKPGLDPRPMTPAFRRTCAVLAVVGAVVPMAFIGRFLFRTGIRVLFYLPQL